MDENDVFFIRDLFSKNLKRLRTSANISQLTLANQVGLSHNFINDIENSKKWPSAKSIGKLAIALRVEPYQFFLSESRWNERGKEVLATYLDDLEDSLNKTLTDYRKRYIPNAVNRINEVEKGNLR